MIKRYNNQSFLFCIPGFIIQALAWDSSSVIDGLVFAIAGTALMVIGGGFYAKAKGRSMKWGLVGFAGILGVICLGLLQDRSGDPWNPPREPESALAYHNRGISHAKNGDFDAAITDYTEAIRLNPEYADAYFNRGVSHRKIGDFDAAITDYSESLRLNPEDAEAYHNRGVSHEQMGNRAEAETDYHRAKKLGYKP